MSHSTSCTVRNMNDTDAEAAIERDVARQADLATAERTKLRAMIREHVTAGRLSEAAAARAARMDRNTIRRMIGKA